MPAILRVLPITKQYVEPYGGAGSILLSKDQSPTEIYSDLDWRLVNLLKAIQDPNRFEKLYHRSYFSLYSREEFIHAMSVTTKDDLDEAAWGFFIAQNQGYGGISYLPGHWGRAFTSDKSVAKKVRTFYLRVDRLPRQHERLQGVQILQEDALDVISCSDTPDTTFLLDPPYTTDSRVNKKVYLIDQGMEHHAKLVDLILSLKGAVVLCGYKDEVYNPLMEAGWERIERKTAASSAARNRGMKTLGTGSLLKHVARTEIIWRNPRAVKLKPRI